MGARKYDSNWRELANRRADGKKSNLIVHSSYGVIPPAVIRSEDLPEQIPLRKCAGMIGIHFKSVERLRDEKKLRFVKRGGRWYTTPEWIAEYLETESKATF